MTTVSFGWASRIGAGFAALALAIPLVGELADATAPLGVPDTLWVKLSALLTALVVVGRMLQAVAVAGRAPTGFVEMEGVPVDEIIDEELTSTDRTHPV